MKSLLCFLLCLLLCLSFPLQLISCGNDDNTAHTESTKEQADGRYYILNTATKKYHLTNCSYLPSAANSKKVLRTAKSAYKGYSPCQHCDP